MLFLEYCHIFFIYYYIIAQQNISAKNKKSNAKNSVFPNKNQYKCGSTHWLGWASIQYD